jgi:hypothetical protein
MVCVYVCVCVCVSVWVGGYGNHGALKYRAPRGNVKLRGSVTRLK